MSSLRNTKNWNRLTRQVISRDFEIDIALGRIPGMSTVIILGYNNDMSMGADKTIFDLSGVRYVFPTGLVDIWISSTNVSDVGIQVSVDGLDDSNNPVLLTGTLNGINPVNIGQMAHVQSCRVLGSQTLGNIYISRNNVTTDGIPNDLQSTLSYIKSGVGITNNAWYKVPKGFSAVTTGIRASTDNATKTALVKTFIKFPGDIVLNTATYTVSASFPEFTFNPPLGSSTVLGGGVIRILPEGTILEFTANPVSNNTQLFFGIDFILVENGLFGNQPLL